MQQLYTDADIAIQQYKSCLGSLEMVYMQQKSQGQAMEIRRIWSNLCPCFNYTLSMCVQTQMRGLEFENFLRLQRFFSILACACIIGEVFFYFTNNFTRLLHKYGSRPAGIPL